MKIFPSLRASLPGALFRLMSVGMAALLLAGSILSTQPTSNAQAAGSATCTSIADGDWASPIWNCPGGPGAADDVVVLHWVTLNTAKSAHTLTVRADAGNNLFGILQFTAPVTLTLSGDLNVDPLGILDPGDETTGGTLNFGPGSQTISTHGRWVDLWNLTKITNQADTLFFDPAVSGQGGVHVLNTMTLKGPGAATDLLLRSAVSGSPWKIWFEVSYDIANVNVMDSINEVGTIEVEQGRDYGNNTNWELRGTSVALRSSVNPGLVGIPVTLTASVWPVTATGTVTFEKDFDDIVGCVGVPVAAGQATCTTTFTLTDRESITASFDAADPMTNSLSNALIQVTLVKKPYFLPNVFR